MQRAVAAYCLVMIALKYSVCSAQCDFTWGRQVGAGSNTECTSVASGDAGSIYTAGSFSGTALFDSVALTTADNFYNPFIAKYDAAGALLWAAGVPGARTAYGMAADRDGNVCITGYFGDRAIAGTDTAISNGDQDLYIARFDARGRPLWLRALGGDSLDVGRAVALDPDGNIYVAGHFSHGITSGAEHVTSRGGNDVLIAKYAPGGTLLWLRSAGGAGDDRAYAVAVSAQGGIYVCGMFEGEAIFGGDTLRVPGAAYAPFVARLDAGGRFIDARAPWVSTAGIARSMAAAKGGGLYVAGEFEGMAAFGTDTLRTHGVRDIFLARLDTAGSWAWARGAGGAAQDGARSVAVDGTGTVYCTGLAADPSFGPLYFGDDTITSGFGSQIFVAAYDSLGRFRCAAIAGGASGDAGNAVAAGPGGDIYVAGAFTDHAEFGSFALDGNGPVNSSGFLARLRAAPAAVHDLPASTGMAAIVPNPAHGAFTIRDIPEGTAHCTITVADLMGRTIYRAAPDASAGSAGIRCDISGVPCGLYVVSIAMEGRVLRRVVGVW
ncbi:MAG: hypothetical protein JST22_00550 [Bacteroidetes bacterium]|nr:hypothetical protein [Bacteroidota bacterium]